MNKYDLAYLPTIGSHYLWHALMTGKYGEKTREKTGRVPDRFRGTATAVLGTGDPHFEAPCLWLHAVSVGEVNAAVGILQEFMRANPRWDVRISTTTATGRAVAEKHFGAECVFYYPLDFSWMVKRAFDKIRPTMIVLMELEIWPNFLAEAQRRKVPVAVANARITERSEKRLGLVPSVARSMAGAVQLWFAQTQDYADRLVRIGVPPERIDVTGSVKYDSVPVEMDERVGQYYRRLFGCAGTSYAQGGDAVVVAGSIHPGEEGPVLEAWSRLRLPEGRKCRLVIAPRHPERLAMMAKAAAAFGVVKRRSELPEPTFDPAEDKAECDIIMVDVMGELSNIYNAADLVFVGGSLIPHGGQNFMEPCGLAKPTSVGPHVRNFSEPAALLTAAGGLRTVVDADDLAAWMQVVLDEPARAEETGRMARETLWRQRGATKRVVERLNLMAKTIMKRSR